MEIFATIAIACSGVALSLFSKAYALGFVGFVFIAHGIFVFFLGPSATHLPLYVAVTVGVFLLVRGQWSVPPLQTVILILVLTLWMGVVVLLSPDQGIALVEFSIYVKAFVLAVLVAGGLHRLEDYERVAAFILAAIFAKIAGPSSRS